MRKSETYRGAKRNAKNTRGKRQLNKARTRIEPTHRLVDAPKLDSGNTNYKRIQVAI